MYRLLHRDVMSFQSMRCDSSEVSKLQDSILMLIIYGFVNPPERKRVDLNFKEMK